MLVGISPSTESTLPDHCCHGTYLRHVPSIFSRGLLRGGLAGTGSRSMNHFIGVHPRSAVGVTSGFHSDAKVAVMIDLRAAIEVGIPFTRAENGVICSDADVGPVFSLQFIDLETFEPIWRPAVSGRGIASARTTLQLSRPWRGCSCGNSQMR
jgi:RNA:NAD 2'-phosphotransferase (TPT1/KptA family)